MLKTFYPDKEADSTYKIDFEALYEQGYRGIIFDVDNTLVPHGAPATKEAIAFFDKLRKIGYQTMLLSNNKEPRVKRFNQEIGSGYIYKAGKPGIKNYHAAMVMMGSSEKNTLFVGDQLFTDVWGANRAGIYSILVKPIDKKDEIQIVLKRYLEKIILHFYERTRG